MLNLTSPDTPEYRPELANDYRWRFDLGQNYPDIEIKVFHKHGGAPVYETSVEISQTDTPEGIRTKVLNKTKQVAGMIRPWNPVYAPMATAVLKSLAPPEDTPADKVTPITDVALGPRTSAHMKLTLPTLGRDK